jgi:hypothetical protein
LEYVDSWNQPVLLRIEDVISDDGKGKARFPNAPLPAISSEIISNLQKSRLLLFGGGIGLFSKPK